MADPVTSTQVPPAIWAAVIAALAGFLVSMLSKEFKVSEFRQAWIDALRNDLAELVSLHLSLNDHLAVEKTRRAADPASLQAAVTACRENFERIEAASARIRLRLNPSEHQKLIELVKRTGAPTESLQHGNTQDADELGEELLAESQRVLKREWARVKRGELTFYCTKWFFLVVLVIAAPLVLVKTCRSAASPVVEQSRSAPSPAEHPVPTAPTASAAATSSQRAP